MGEFIQISFNKWCEQLTPGHDLFVCMPAKNPVAGIFDNAVIDFDDEVEFEFFRINLKKKFAATHVDSEYVLLVHDRFIPGPNFFNAIVSGLASDRPDFFAFDVDNTDGTPSLRELRVKGDRLGLSAPDAFDLPGRCVCSHDEKDASSHVGLNGGQFGLHRSCIDVLERPMSWFEMEDDVMSMDLVGRKGVWYSVPSLITLAHKSRPQDKEKVFLKIWCYAYFCNFLRTLSKVFTKHELVYSVGDATSCKEMREFYSSSVLLIDPLHKRALGGHLDNALEKFTAKLRLSEGRFSTFSVAKSRLGWVISHR